MSRLGDTIRAARLKKKMTEKALGKKCGMAENVIKDIEAGLCQVADHRENGTTGMKESLHAAVFMYILIDLGMIRLE